MFREWDFLPENVGECRIAVLALERRCAVQHLVYQDPQSPPIHSASVAAAFDNFWRNVFLRPHKRIRSEIGYTRFRIDRWQGRGTCAVLTHDHRRLSTGVGLLGQVEVRQHYMPGLMK